MLILSILVLNLLKALSSSPIGLGESAIFKPFEANEYLTMTPITTVKIESRNDTIFMTGDDVTKNDPVNSTFNERVGIQAKLSVEIRKNPTSNGFIIVITGISLSGLSLSFFKKIVLFQ